MTRLSSRRLRAQRLFGRPFASAVDAVRWLGAVQSQDYAGAKWALGQRTQRATDAELDRVFDEGAILRTHVLRPTWHFVLPDDIRWLLELTAPRIKATLAHYDRDLGIDAALLRRSHAILERVLANGAHRTRGQLAAVLERAGIPASGPLLAFLMMHAELDGIVASGRRRGKQQTYALLAERAPSARRLDRDTALAELTHRYFTSHGPAQVQDFAWWSGLTVADAKRGLALLGSDLAHEIVGGKPYWSSPERWPLEIDRPIVRLLPNYDEFLVAYRDRSALVDPSRAPLSASSLIANAVVVDGQVLGGWRRREHRGQVVIELGRLGDLDAAATASLHRAASAYGRFLGVSVVMAAAG